MIFSTPGSAKLAKQVAKLTRFKHGKTTFDYFENGDPRVTIDEPRRRKRATIISSMHTDVMELLWLINATKNATGKKPNVITPFIQASRQDKTDKTNDAIGIEVIGSAIKAAGTKRLYTIDIHSRAAFNKLTPPCTNLTALPLLAKSLKIAKKNAVVVAPDGGAAHRAKQFAKLAGISSVAYIEKVRTLNGVKATHLTGDVTGKDIVIIDDMIDTGSTLLAAMRLLKKQKAKSIQICATHGVFSINPLLKLRRAGATKITITDTIPVEKKPTYLKIISIAPLIADTF